MESRNPQCCFYWTHWAGIATKTLALFFFLHPRSPNVTCTNLSSRQLLPYASPLDKRQQPIIAEFQFAPTFAIRPASLHQHSAHFAGFSLGLLHMGGGGGQVQGDKALMGGLMRGT